MERRGAPFEEVLAEAQRLGFAEADPSADVDGFDARSKLVLLAALAFGERITPSDVFMEGIRRITPIDYRYALQLKHTIRLVCGARATPDGLILFVRPALIPVSTILAGVHGSYNAVWVKGKYGSDTFYYGRGAGSLPTGVAVVSDLMRVAREIRSGSPERVSPFAHERLGETKPVSIEVDAVLTTRELAKIIRMRGLELSAMPAETADTHMLYAHAHGPGILASKNISLEAILQEPYDGKHDLPFVITVEPTSEQSIREAVAEMSLLDFLTDAPLALPMETAL